MNWLADDFFFKISKTQCAIVPLSWRQRIGRVDFLMAFTIIDTCWVGTVSCITTFQCSIFESVIIYGTLRNLLGGDNNPTHWNLICPTSTHLSQLTLLYYCYTISITIISSITSNNNLCYETPFLSWSRG